MAAAATPRTSATTRLGDRRGAFVGRGRLALARRGLRTARPYLSGLHDVPSLPASRTGDDAGGAAAAAPRTSAGPRRGGVRRAADHAAGQLFSMSSSTPLREPGPSCMYSDHPGPEAPCADLAGHQVRRVEPARPARQGLREDRRRVGQDLVRVAVGPDVDVRGDPRRERFAALGALDRLAQELLEEVRDLGTVPVGAHDRELAGQERSLLVDRREREPVVVHPGLGVLRERRGADDEARLTVEPALRRVVEHRERSGSERDRRRVGRATEDVAVLEHHFAERLGRRRDRRVVEGDLVRHPLVVDVRARPSGA